MVPTHSLRNSRIISVLFAVTVFWGGFFLAFGISLRHADHHLGSLRINSDIGLIVVGLGIAFLIVSALARRIPAALQLCVATIGICIGTILCFTSPLGTVHVVEVNQEGFEPNQPPVRYYKSTPQPGHTYYSSGYHDDPRGWRLTPGSYALESHLPDYKDAHYQIDLEGWRECPDLRPRVLFLGCSFTFGAGVQDDEFYVGRFAQAISPAFHVVNCAQSGWGTSEANTVLESELENHPHISAVIYGWIADHLARNYTNISWHKNLNSDSKFPYFELVNGKAEFKGFKTHGECVSPDDAETAKKEVELAKALILRLKELCTKKEIPFFVLLLSSRFAQYHADPIPDWLRSSGVDFIDVRAASEDFYPNDSHPTAKWHASVAKELAQSPKLNFLKRSPSTDEPQK